MNSDHDGGRPSILNGLWRFTSRLRPNGALALLGIVTLVGLCVFAWQFAASGKELGDTSSVATLIGLALTIYIFAWTLWSSEATSKLLGDMQDLLTRIHKDLSDAFESTAAEEPDKFDEPEEDAAAPDEYANEPTGVIGEIRVQVGGYDFVPAANIPMRVIRDLVDGWDEQGLTGAWNVGELDAGFRKRGRGNHAWYLAFADKAVFWKVARGGKGKSRPTVVEIPMKSKRRQ